MFWNKKICSKCKIGKQSYDLDKHSETCPYIICWKKGKCRFYVPLEKVSKKGVLKTKNKSL